jgi:hypothetical protein
MREIIIIYKRTTWNEMHEIIIILKRTSQNEIHDIIIICKKSSWKKGTFVDSCQICWESNSQLLNNYLLS